MEDSFAIYSLVGGLGQIDSIDWYQEQDKQDMSSQPASAAIGARPRTRQRAFKAPPPLNVPDIDEDAAERKRVLNVLAQRRYRERKRANRLKAAHAQPQPQLDAGYTADTADTATADEPGPSSRSQGTVESGVPVAEQTSLQDSTPDFGTNPALSLSSWDPLSDVSPSSVVPEPILESLPEFISDHGSSEADLLLDSLTATSASISPRSMTLRPGTPTSLEKTSSNSPVSTESGFPDSYLLPVHELTTLRAILRIADSLGCATQFWSIDAPSPFVGGPTPEIEKLPLTLRPTTAQLLIPHHPLLDLIPWAPARDKLINLLSLPDEARPPTAAGPMALVNFAYDLEDNAEGVRIYGSDPFDASSWEVGQVLFERWWFIFDRDIIDTSNRWRRMRGAPPLQIRGPDT
ncbi:hypothetical protein B0I35DRAFT_6196 [Stachybotrys elegans]|uniref:BZIP domain-containing protein n=1 Tax=Stachybotrys elegans TaxID=80388 RepID=A0A8K0WX13_9HYPO|nr:hypothetical protein B0I35DRAFT_6196 [Stachybotrys elegans]